MGITNSTYFIVQMNLFAGQEERHRHREWIYGHRGMGMTHIHYDVLNRVSGKLPYHTRSSARRSLMTWSCGLRGGGGKEVQEERDICIHIADSLHCTAEKNTTL